MNAPAPTAPLRPLGIGEILDRAVTLCVRFFVPFASIYLAYGLPLGVVNYFATRNLATVYGAMIDQIRAQAAGHAGGPNALANALANSNGNQAWVFVLLAIVFFVSPLMTGALVDATSESYFGRRPTFARAYRVGFARWANVIGINVLFLFAGGAIYSVTVVVAVVLVLAAVAIASAAHVVGIVAGVAIGLAFLVVDVAFALVVAVAYQVACFACVVEHANFAASFASAMSRVWNRVGLRRSLLVGLAYLAVAIGIAIVAQVGAAVLLGLLHSALAAMIFNVVVGLGTAALLTAFMAVFYYDLRVREEGLDLTLRARDVLERPLSRES